MTIKTKLRTTSVYSYCIIINYSRSSDAAAPVAAVLGCTTEEELDDEDVIAAGNDDDRARLSSCSSLTSAVDDDADSTDRLRPISLGNVSNEARACAAATSRSSSVTNSVDGSCC